MERYLSLRSRFKNADLDAMLLTSDSNRLFISGIRCSFGAVLVTMRSFVYFTDARFAETAMNSLGENHVQIVTGTELYPAIARQLQSDGVKRLGIEEDHLSFCQFQSLKLVTTVEFCPAQQVINLLRAVKSETDLRNMIAAQQMTEEAFQQVLPLIHSGVTEREIAAELIYRMFRLGAAKISFDPIIVAGSRTSLPHGRPTNYAIQSGDFVTMDFGFVVNGWCSDMTRTVAVGHATDEMRQIYDTVLAAQEAGIRVAKAGITGQQIDAAARQVICDAGYGMYFCHGFGHGIGIEGHESPGAGMNDTTPLPIGTMISAEPGIYIPRRMGVRIEDVIYLTETGSLDITRVSKEFTVL